MNKNTKVVFVLLLSICAIGLCAWHYRARVITQPANYEIVRDRSASTRGDCGCLMSLAKRALESPHVSEGSTLSVTITGDETTANEPLLLARYKIPVSRRVLDGRSTTARQVEEKLADLNVKCGKVAQTKKSPIFLAVKRAVEELRSTGCNAHSHCAVYVETDLEESADTQIRAALNSVTQAKQVLPAPINNEGIDVVIYGIAETNGLKNDETGKTRSFTRVRDSKRVDRLREVWSGLFTNPELVIFEPHCTGS